ncbi:gluconate 2-dehydrogenase subunit 3 family protein [Marivita sp. S0852]|uniref:gluconate 2-dehydrogenase subunit 3 family protein n=1 Tax=Marivita sp. S0852 TaxID=3373893 RepID=UPI003982BAA2
MPKLFSRRAVLAQIAGTAALATTPPHHAFANLDSEPWSFLTDDEAQWLAAIADVFIPQDEFPSASQAGVVDYIDLQMATGYGTGEGLYLKGPFPEGTPQQGYQLPLSPAELLRAGINAARSEIDLATTPLPERESWVQEFSERDESAIFFNEVLSLTNEGYFADPIYRGNHEYAGWRMVGFPGAHAYFTERVGDNKPTTQPPMGIAHGQMNHTLPRPIGQEG